MFTENDCRLLGRVGKELELKNSNGTPWVSFSIATDRPKKNEDGSWGSISHWHNITIFGKQAETAARHLKVGSRVLVKGEYIYEEGEGGKRFYKLMAKDIVLIDYQKGEGKAAGAQSSASAGSGNKTTAPAATVADEDIPF